MDISGIQHSVRHFIYDYNENINYYNRNMRDLINIYERSINNIIIQENNRGNHRGNHRGNIHVSHENSSVPSRPNISNNNNNTRTFARTTNRWSPFNSYSLNNPIGSLGFGIPINTMQYEDVVVRPSNYEITVATEMIHWDISFSQISCPISLERFEPMQNICRIIPCGHMYNNDSLMHWFQTNVRCPVCRYDIRDYDPSGSLYEPVNNDPVVPNYESDNQSDDNHSNDFNDNNIPDSINENNNSEIDDILYQSTILNRNYNENHINNEETQNNRANRNNQENRNNRNNRNNQYNENNSFIRNNLTTIFRSFLTDELSNQIPLVNNSVNDFLYGLSIPIEFDISYSNLSTNPYIS